VRRPRKVFLLSLKDSSAGYESVPVQTNTHNPKRIPATIMKTSLLTTLAAACLLVLPTVTTRAQSNWQTVADSQGTHAAAVDALTKDAAGNLYAAVSTTDAEWRTHALIRKSSDHGATWAVVEDFVSADRCSTKILSLGVDAASHLYAAGYATDENGQTQWIVRKSGGGGNSWSTVDDFAWPDAQTTVAQGFAADAAGNLYVAGYRDESPSDGKSSPQMHWLVRQSRDGGRNWSTIDDFSYGFNTRAAAIVSTSSGLFVAGSGWNGKSESGERWLARKGTDDGAGGFRWQTVDEFQLQENKHGYGSRVQGLGVDGRGNLYAVGRCYAGAESAMSAHWVVRRASSAGTDWTVVDSFQLDPGYFATACGVAAGSQGDVYVVGRAGGSNPGCHWIVRKSATGDSGSWAPSDDFRRPAPPEGQTTSAADQVIVTADGSMVSPPTVFASGLAILSDSTRVFTGGGLVHAGLNHATVRELESVRQSELTIVRAP
jgi:hypothetical protein